MICPQCKTVYEDDYVFCLTDGNSLIDDSGEQETVVNRIKMSPPAGEGLLVKCRSCGLANRSNSRFCKKCGADIEAGQPTVDGSAFDFNAFPAASSFTVTPKLQPENTIVFRPPTVSAGSSAPGTAGFLGGTQNQVLFIGCLAAALIIGGAIIYSASGGPSTSSAGNNYGIRAANATNVAMNAANTVSNVSRNAQVSSADGWVGRTGTLSRDVVLRPYAGAEDDNRLGIHYRGARVRVLEVSSATNSEGESFAWFKIAVTRYGTSMDANNVGYDKDPGTPDEGWVHSYPKVWFGNRQQRVNLIEFD